MRNEKGPQIYKIKSMEESLLRHQSIECDMTPDLSKKIGIFYFSGTGNTEIVANLLTKEFKNRGVNTEITKIEDILKNNVSFEPEKYDIIGMGFCIHAFNAPRIFFKFVRRLPVVKDKKTFIFKCSADLFMKGGTTTMVRNRLKEKGYTVFYEDLFLMPSNFIMLYNDELIKQLYTAAVLRASLFSEEILSGKVNLQKNGLIPRFITWFVSGTESMGAPHFAKDLEVRKSCNLCGVCIRNCPTNNISLKGDKITFGWNCVTCLRCVYRCPEKAISPRLYKYFLIRGGYDIQKVIDNPNIKGNYITENTKGYYRRFYDYLAGKRVI